MAEDSLKDWLSRMQWSDDAHQERGLMVDKIKNARQGILESIELSYPSSVLPRGV